MNSISESISTPITEDPVHPLSTSLEYEESRLATNMTRAITWKHVFFLAAGAPALVMFSLGSIADLTGPVAVLAWTLSALMGFIQCGIYAEIAGLHPRKSGGTAVHGATAWIRYSKIMAPMSLWSNWLAWSPILAIGCGLAAGYLLSIFFAADSAVRTWELTIANLSFIKDGLSLRINATFILAAIIALVIWNIQHFGVLRTARASIVLTVGSMLPLLLVTIVPIFQGGVVMSNFSPFVPANGSWNVDGWTLFLGSWFIAGWAAYGFETAVCYMSELKNPKADAWRAIVASGIFNTVVYITVPFTFQGVLGTKYMQSPGIYDGSGVGQALASMVNSGPFFTKIWVVLLVFTLFLAIMTAMAGSSRTIFQGGQDGWLPKYLSHLNKHKVPTYAMWTDLAFNMILLLMSDYVFVLAVSSVNYFIFNYLNLNAGWIHRIDNPKVPRPFKLRTPFMVAGVTCAYINAFLIGAGANVWGKGTLLAGLIAAFISVPVFMWRHYVTDKGKFPDHMLVDLVLDGQTEIGPKRAGMLPYVALAGGIGCMLLGYIVFWVILQPTI